MKNTAFVFIKPHAVTEATKAMVEETLKNKGLDILKQGELSGKEIDEKQLIDQHYYAIASKATLLKPKDLPVPADKFKKMFGLEWSEALESGKVFNALDACKKLNIDSDRLNEAWAAAKKADKLVKFGGGFYCGLIDTIENQEPIYSFNGFFMQMRSQFVAPEAKIYYYVVEWEPSTLSWADFRGQLLGPTDPADAPLESVRGKILAQWKELGLESEPNTGNNGVHASASPFEGLAERMNWLSVKVEDDSFGAALMQAGIPEKVIKEWSVDPQVSWADQKSSLFDALEDLDAEACLSKSLEIHSKAN